jgi:uncharacterized protein with PIN domain
VDKMNVLLAQTKPSDKLMKKAEFRFYEELNDFLSIERRKKSFSYYFSGNPTIKDAIEACGVPHPEIEVILVNGNSVGFDHHLCDSDRVAVYPVFESLDISSLVKLREKPLRDIKFVIDVNLGKLARSLRMLGFDSIYDNTLMDKEIAQLSSRDGRLILTRDQNLLKYKTITHGYWLRSINPSNQIKEIIQRFDLISVIAPFSRCMDCNGLLKSVKKNDVIKSIPPRTRKYYSEFYQCNSCERIYWPGSHYKKMLTKIDTLKDDVSISPLPDNNV